MPLPVITSLQDTPDPAALAHRLRLREEEYAALRATIRERGTRRMTLVVASLASWALLALLSNDASWPTPLWTLVPLIVLVAGFEAGFVMHVGVERIGRYLQVEYERGPRSPGWEHAAMRFGTVPAPAGGRTDPLFSVVFILGVALNTIPTVQQLLAGVVMLSDGQWQHPSVVGVSIVALAHLAVIVRILRARAYAAQQRALDLAALTQQPRE